MEQFDVQRQYIIGSCSSDDITASWLAGGCNESHVTDTHILVLRDDLNVLSVELHSCLFKKIYISKHIGLFLAYYITYFKAGGGGALRCSGDVGALPSRSGHNLDRDGILPPLQYLLDTWRCCNYIFHSSHNSSGTIARRLPSFGYLWVSETPWGTQLTLSNFTD